MPKHTLFPPYLNPGSFGGAVNALHMFLEALDFGVDVERNLHYGAITTLQVRRLQETLGVDSDGKFGPATRAALKAKHGIDIHSISWTLQDGVTMWVDNQDARRCWPPPLD